MTRGEQLANTLFGQAEERVVTGQDSGLPLLLAVPSGVKLRQLEAFVAVATELHFGLDAAEALLDRTAGTIVSP